MFEVGLTPDEIMVAMLGAFGGEAQKAARIDVVDAALARRQGEEQHRMLPMFYMAQGAYDEGLELFYARPDPIDEVLFGRIWSDVPALVEFRRSERMQDFAERAGLLEYGMRYGWPTMCPPVEPGSDQFRCS